MVWVITMAAAVIAGFVAWRCDSVRRGMMKVHRKIDADIEPLLNVLRKGDKPSQELLESVTKRPENRSAVWQHLTSSDLVLLFPNKLLAPVEVGAAALSRWCMHPNEFGLAPQIIQPITSHQVHMTDGHADYLVFRMAWEPSHDTKGESILGVVGPFGDDFPPFSYQSAFSRGDREGACSSKELVEWFMKVNRLAPLRIDDAKPLS